MSSKPKYITIVFGDNSEEEEYIQHLCKHYGVYPRFKKIDSGHKKNKLSSHKLSDYLPAELAELE